MTEEVDADLKAVDGSMRRKLVEDKMEELRVADAMTEIFNLFKRCNKYIDETMPWGTGKRRGEERPSGNCIVEPDPGNFTQGAVLLESFMPSTSKKILEQLGGGTCD